MSNDFSAYLAELREKLNSVAPVSAEKDIPYGHQFTVLRGSEKAVRVTIGLFTIVQLERDVQILVPACDFCIPNKECSCNTATEDPCDAFRKIRFPVNEFFPVSEKDAEKNCNSNYNFNTNCSCGCKQ